MTLSQFTNREMMHFVRGEPLETVQAAALMVQFIGEEKTRLVLGQEPKTVAIVRQMASNFDNLSKEEKFKAGIKLYLLLVTPPVTLAKTAGTIGRVSDKAVSAIRKTGKTARPLPTAPLRVNPPRAAKNSLGELTNHNFTPAFDQIKSFTVKAALDGDLYPADKLPTLVNYLNKRGVNVYGTEGNPKFVAKWDGSGQIYLPSKPTVLQVKHELSHYLDFKKYGVHEYVKLTRYDRERLVLERLKDNRLWSGLNELEKEFSEKYVKSLEKNTNLVRKNHE